MNSRPIIRCLRCRLNQYEAADGNCRRCHTPFSRFPNVVSIPAKPESKYRTTLLASVGDAVWTYRHCRGFSQTELEMLTGVMHNTISRIETSNRIPALDVLERLAEGLAVPIGWLLEAPTPERESEIFSEQVMITVKHIEGFEKRKRIIFDAVSKLMIWQKADKRSA